ncbi:MAG: peptidoglycan-associated lipoprotein Pal [Candidatus Dadabacteria bacterium]|nr:MAG: peptidoglycan-associated lipoprotein Pal [Candidatus Dadabacteria bacterium]
MACAVAVALAAGGCAARKGGWFGRSSEEPPPPAPISEEGLAGKPSIEQFEQTGTVRPGGTFEDVHFAFDSAQLDEAAMEVVRRNAELLRANPTSKVEIEGHCDERGTSEYNLALGSRRARAVRDALVGLGISADRLTTVSYGEELPLCKESTEECWAQNRRAHLVEVSR